MKKRMLSMLLAIVMVVGLAPGFAITASAADITPSQPAGDGSAGNPYQIGTAAELYWFANKVNTNTGARSAHAVLTADITVNENVLNAEGSLNGDSSRFAPWTPIGNAYAIKYTGQFDGKGHTVSGLYLEKPSSSYVGLFGHVGDGGVIKNVTVEDSYFSGRSGIGGIIGYTAVDAEVSVENCHNGATVTVYTSGNGNGAGGIIGNVGNNGGSATIINCTNYGKISVRTDNFKNFQENSAAGGIVGWAHTVTFENCHNSGDITGIGQLGGLVGEVYFRYAITLCSNTGNITGTDFEGNTPSGGTETFKAENIGGLVGIVTQPQSGLKVDITDCFNAGEISGYRYIGGLVGSPAGSVNSYRNVHNYGEVTSQTKDFIPKPGAGLVEVMSNCFLFGSTGTVENGYYLDTLKGTATGVAKTADEFANGTVVTLLNDDRNEADAVWEQGAQYPVLKPVHTHDWTYTANGATTITATCGNTDKNCPDTKGGSVSIAAPVSTEYTGSAVEAKVTNTLTTGDTVTVTYSGDNLVNGLPVKIGTYTATLTVGGAEISVTYTITHASHNLEYSNITDTQHTASCACGYSEPENHDFEHDAVNHACACGKVEQFTITYTDGVDGEIFADVVETVDYNTTTPPFGANDPTRTGYTFNGWNPTVAEKVTENATYTAQWAAHTYTVKFDANGGTGSMADMSFTYGESQNLTANAFTYANMHFTGWNTVSGGTGTAYQDGQEIDDLIAENNGVVTLYAQWRDKSAQTITLDTSDRNATYGDGTLAAREITASGAITYSSSDESVATVDENGVITVLKVGDTTITVTAAETEEYASGSVSYKLIVAPKTLTITADSHEVYVGSRQPELTYTVDGLVGDDALTLAPTLTTDADMYRAGTYAITFASEAAAGDNYSITYVNGTLTVKNYPYSPSDPTYPPVVDSGDNGDVVVTPKNPEKGDTVTITPAPDAGFEVDDVIVTDKNGDPVTVVDNGDGSYSFKQPSGKVNIKVTFKEIVKVCPRDWTCPMYGYTDLDRAAWYHDGVHFCIENDLMQGIDNNEFAPNDATTRAMIVTILWRLEGSPDMRDALWFEDVPVGQWYSDAIAWAAFNGIVDGYGNGYFGTSDAITREQMAAIMFRYAKYKGYDVSVGENTNILSYGDAFDVAEWAIPAMQWACGSGMIQGIADGSTMNLEPQGNATRAQAAAILQRFIEQVVNEK